MTGLTDASLTAKAAPVADSKRIDAIDTLRGFAIFGIYAVNIGTFAWPSAAMADPRVMGDTWWNHAGHQLTSTVFFGKFMFLFAMLFGATIVFFDRKTTPTHRKPRVSDGTGLWARRQGVLLAFGVAHALLLWYGDILAPYAVVGFVVAWWLRKLSWKWHVGLGVAAHLIGSSLLAGLFMLSMSQSEAAMAQQLEMEREAHLGDYLGLLQYRAFFLLFFWGIVGPIFTLQIGAMMLWGVSLARAGILTAQRPTAFYAKAAAILLPVGAVFTLGVFYGIRLVLDDRTTGAIWTGFGQFVGVPLGLGYAALVVWITKAGVARVVTRGLANVGRMGLTNYLLQSVISAVIFYGWGFGLFGEIGYPGLFAIIGGMWAFNVAFSAAWLSVFRIGPVEWLWRALTYWTLPPLVRERADAP